MLLNVLAHEVHAASQGESLSPAMLFTAVACLQRRVQDSYAAVAQVAGHGILAFRDPQGIRPLCLGLRASVDGNETMFTSESVALEGMGFSHVREIVQLARLAGATSVALASTAPPVRHPKVYGVDWPARRKPASMGATHDEMRANVTADALVFQDLKALKAAIAGVNPALRELEISCFE